MARKDANSPLRVLRIFAVKNLTRKGAKAQRVFWACFFLVLNQLVLNQSLAWGQSSSGYRVVVNSNDDGARVADDVITLREAIEIVNGTLPIDNLSPQEKNQIESVNSPSIIAFNLNAGQTTIQLKSILPALSSTNLIIDGTTQLGYINNQGDNTLPTTVNSISKPIVSITAADGKEILRGLTVVADGVTIKGLNIYGFTKSHGFTASLPSADIFIASKDIDNHSNPPKNVVIEDNWLGITLNEEMPSKTSAFGVSVFNAIDTVIKHNRISFHDGSGIITGYRAEGMQVISNQLTANGLAGIPDGIRLDGIVNKSQIKSNLICANDGSGVFLFKPQGSVEIRGNKIQFNGRRYRRSAVYLMGNGHQVIDNQIYNQSGSGVVVAAYPDNGAIGKGASSQNIIQNNRFSYLEGMSIDLNAVHNLGVTDFQNGDGPNPQRNSENRRLDTANGAINTPQFLSHEFFEKDISDKGTSTVGIDGIAEAGSLVDIYKVDGDSQNRILSEPLGSVTTDAKGKFSLEVSNLKPGDRIGAIATHPKYGTSEPAFPSIIKSLSGGETQNPTPTQEFTNQIPECLTAAAPPTPEPTPDPAPETPTPDPTPETPPDPAPETPPEVIKLKVPRDIHFALDKDFVSKPSAVVLDKIVAVMKQYPTIIIELQGHTDARASDTYNQDLAFRRARNTRNYLIKKGIASERMTIRSLGERKLKTPGANKLQHAQNRRVEVIFKDVRGVEITFEQQDRDLQIEP
jgi:outer membrane protein OmpA-like peptidoglycan-associated protein